MDGMNKVATVTTTAASRKSTIKRLDELSVSKICVNQVIADLTSCVKELVENSLDAGATRIEINLKEQGKEGIDVIDNGSGITRDNLNKIAEKGATSKLREFDDMTNLRTFGFRGEALNALSVLCTLTITTRIESEELGLKYTFGDNKGQQSSQPSCVPSHRERGTTISLRNIFAKIPVRKQEFEKNISSQYTKMLNVMREYMLIAQQCQIFVVNDSDKRGRQVVLNSGLPMPTMKHKVAEVFGHSLSDQLSDLSFDFSNGCRVEGLVMNKSLSGSNQTIAKSPILKNKGFIWVNNRPTSALPKTNSIFSEIYKKYNESAEFVYFLHIKVQADDVDFNLSPDKREIILKPEKEFYAALHSNLLSFFENLGAVSKVILPQSNKRSDLLTIEPQESAGMQQTKLKIKSLIAQNISPMEDEIMSKSSLQSQQKFDSQLCVSSKSQGSNIDSLFGNTYRSRAFKEDSVTLVAQRKLAMERMLSRLNESCDESPEVVQEKISDEEKNQPEAKSFMLEKAHRRARDHSMLVEEEVEEAKSSDMIPEIAYPTTRNEIKQVQLVAAQITNSHCCSASTHECSSHHELQEQTQQQQESSQANKPRVAITDFKLLTMPQQIEKKTYLKELADESFCERQIDEMFTKEEFPGLHVLGQFNKAFIIAYSSKRNEIFLIDQHASDEKTNYEKLMKENVFQCQKLLQPICLDVTNNEVDILENNRDLFTRNGFSFTIDTCQDGSKHTLRIEQLPCSKHIQFDINDFDELFSKLSCETFDAQHYRPKKIQRVLASKACRKSIMIGDALNEQQMKQILMNLSQLQSPWNCPHGRPTMVKTPPFSQMYAQIKVKNRFLL